MSGVPTRRILEPIFGEASLFAARNSDACWVRTSPAQVYQKGSTQWVANLYGGIQTNDDWASVVIPVNELPVTDLKTAMWTYFLTNAESAGVNIVIWAHDPNDYSKRAEITQTPGKAAKAAGFNRETLDSTATELFYYGENISGSGLTAGTLSTWTAILKSLYGVLGDIVPVRSPDSTSKYLVAILPLPPLSGLRGICSPLILISVTQASSRVDDAIHP